MAIQFKTSMLVVPLTVLVLGFQNCSSPKFSTTESASVKATDSSGGAQTQTQTQTTQTTDGTSGFPIDVSTGLPTDTSTSSQNGTCHNKHGEHAASGPTDYRLMCSKLLVSPKSVKLASDLNIVNHSGLGLYIANSYNHVDGNSGAMALACVHSPSANGVIASLDNNSGLTVVCGCDVKEIKNHSGAVVVVDGDVGSVTGSSGLILVGGAITGDSSGNFGQIASTK